MPAAGAAAAAMVMVMVAAVAAVAAVVAIVLAAVAPGMARARTSPVAGRAAFFFLVKATQLLTATVPVAPGSGPALARLPP